MNSRSDIVDTTVSSILQNPTQANTRNKLSDLNLSEIEVLINFNNMLAYELKVQETRKRKRGYHKGKKL